jgi:selenophosphate synthase
LRQADLPTSIPSGSELDQIADLGDVHRLDFRDPVHSLVVSSDLLFQISNHGEIFGAVTGMHAMSDIYAGLGQPLFGCATLAADEELLAAGFGVRLYRALVHPCETWALSWLVVTLL